MDTGFATIYANKNNYFTSDNMCYVKSVELLPKIFLYKNYSFITDYDIITAGNCQ